MIRSALRIRQPLPPGNILRTHFCQRLSRTQGHNVTGSVMSTKNCSETIGNPTRDLPACSAVPQPAAPAHVPFCKEKTENVAQICPQKSGNLQTTNSSVRGYCIYVSTTTNFKDLTLLCVFPHISLFIQGFLNARRNAMHDTNNSHLCSTLCCRSETALTET